MVKKFIANVREDQDTLWIELRGEIDEDVEFERLQLNLKPNVIIDLHHVNTFNSSGIREWIKWMDMLSDCNLKLARCPKLVVDQINKIEGFLPKHSQVISFYVPYYNEENDSERTVLFEEGKEFIGDQITFPSPILDEHGSTMDPDILPSTYFRFLKKQKDRIA